MKFTHFFFKAGCRLNKSIHFFFFCANSRARLFFQSAFPAYWASISFLMQRRDSVRSKWISSCRSLLRPGTLRSRCVIGRRIAKTSCVKDSYVFPLCELCFYCGDYFVRSSIVIQFAAQMGLSIVSCSQQRTPFRKRFCESQPAVPLYKVALAAGRSNLANDQFVQIASPPCNITVTRYDRAAARENGLTEYAGCYVFPMWTMFLLL